MGKVLQTIIATLVSALIVSVLGYVWLEARKVKKHVTEEVPVIKQWIDYDEPSPDKPSVAKRIAALETSLSTTREEWLKAQGLLDQLLGPVAGEATRQIPDKRGTSSGVAVYINLAGAARKFMNESELVITNAEQLSETIPVNNTFRFPKDYEDAEILLTVRASEQLRWDDNVKGKKRMPVTIKRVAN